MVRKKILIPDRIRQIDGGFGFIPHRFLTDGFLFRLSQHELLLYLFLILAADRYGLSFYGQDSICSYLGLNADQYYKARDGLVEKDLVAFDGTLFQVLSLPPSLNSCGHQRARSASTNDPESIAQMLQKTLKGMNP